MQQFFKLSIDTSLTPIKQELQEVISILGQIFQGRQLQLSRQIQHLYFHVVLDQKDYMKLPNCTMKKILILLHKIPIKSEGYNEIFLRTVAKIYCFYNNNFSSFKTLTKEYGLPLQLNQYEFRSIGEILIKDTLRSIEDVIINNEKKAQIDKIDEQQIKYAEKILLNIQKQMSLASQILFKQQIINRFFLEKPNTIQNAHFYQFYRELRNLISKRQADLQEIQIFKEPIFRSNQIENDKFKPDYQTFSQIQYDLSDFKIVPKHHIVFEDDPDIWTSQIEQEIIALFLEYRDITKIRKAFLTKYLYFEELCDVGRIKRKFIKIIRASVRMLQQFYREHKDDKSPPLPKLIDLDEQKVKYLIGSPYQIKALLCQFFRQKSMGYRCLCQTITQINYFIRQKAQTRFKKTIKKSKAVIFSL